jgi:aspartokinase-like uncharacterized kinase
MNPLPLVAKVGGSLYDLPDLAERLDRWLGMAGSAPVVLVPGGGRTTDGMRFLDRIHRLGEENSHWLALRALTVNAHFLARLIPDALVVPGLPGGGEPTRTFIIDPVAFCLDDETRPGRLPHHWQVTSDSIAVRIAARASADGLVLLKSVAWPDTGDWAAAARAGVVDAYFPEALRQVPDLSVRVVNLRDRAFAV